MTPTAYDALGQVVVSLPACLLLAVVGIALSLRKDRLYALLTAAAALWLVQTGVGAVVGGIFSWSAATGAPLPDMYRFWAPSVSAGGQTALQTLSWVAIAVAMLWPRPPRHIQDLDALPEDVVA